MLTICTDDPASPAVAGLLAEHAAFAYAHTPSQNAHVLNPDGLAASSITFYAAWDGDGLAGMAALKELGSDHGEIKSMRTAADHQRRGIARAMLEHLVEEARRRGYRRLSLETGTAPAFAPANALYEAFGFVDGPVFGGYPPSPHNRFMTLTL